MKKFTGVNFCCNFLWIEDFSLPATNNLSERGLRGVKSHMKISGQFESEAVADNHALNRTYIETCRCKVTGDVEARICAIACSEPPEGASRWTMQAITDELIRLEAVDYITDATVCGVMKKTKSNHGL